MPAIKWAKRCTTFTTSSITSISSAAVTVHRRSACWTRSWANCDKRLRPGETDECLAQIFFQERRGLIQRPLAGHGAILGRDLDVPASAAAHAIRGHFPKRDFQRAALPVPAIPQAQIFQRQIRDQNIIRFLAGLDQKSGA